LTIANFIQFEMMEERLVNRLKAIAIAYHPIKVELKNYGSFPSNTIFINVDTQLRVKNLVKAIRPAQQLMTVNKDTKPHFIDTPYLSIARKLVPWQYEQGWRDYRNKHFTGRFIADAMLVLKRPMNEKKFQVAQRLEFQSLRVKTKQEELFR
jgi:2'-5' RNA ligase